MAARFAIFMLCAASAVVVQAYYVCGEGTTFAADPHRNDCVMGWATQHSSGAPTGGQGAAASNIYIVSTRAQLWAAMGSNPTPGVASVSTTVLNNTARIVYINGTIRGDDLGNGTYADAAYYRTKSGSQFYHWLYLQSFNTTFMDALKAKAANGTAADVAYYNLALNQTSLLTAFYKAQSAQITLFVPSNTSLLGLPGSSPLLQGTYLRLKGSSNVVFRGFEMEAALDLATTWDPSDGFNAQYDAITVEGATRCWFDHLTLSDGRFLDEDAGVFMGHEIQYHDGLLDIKSAADYLTISHCLIAKHDKTNLFGASDTATTDAGHLRVTMFANVFSATVQRTPRVRFGKIHLLSNYYAGTTATSYFIGMGINSSIFSEGNVFEAPTSSVIVSNLKGYIFNDVASCFNGTAASTTIIAAAKAAFDSAKSGQTAAWAQNNFTTDLGWTVPYSYESPSSCSATKTEVLANAGSDKMIYDSASSSILAAVVSSSAAGTKQSSAATKESSAPTAESSSPVVPGTSTEGAAPSSSPFVFAALLVVLAIAA